MQWDSYNIEICVRFRGFLTLLSSRFLLFREREGRAKAWGASRGGGGGGGGWASGAPSLTPLLFYLLLAPSCASSFRARHALRARRKKTTASQAKVS